MRKTKHVVVPDGFGRDVGKHFWLTEMSAINAEKWALRMLVAIKGTGGKIQTESQGMGMLGIAFAGINAFLSADVKLDIAEPLLDEMMECIQVIRDPAARNKVTGEVVMTPLIGENDIEEVRTRFWLRGEVLELHTGFSAAGVLSTWISATKALAESESTKTSLPQSDSLSPAEKLAG